MTSVLPRLAFCMSRFSDIMIPTEAVWLTKEQEKAMMDLHRLNFYATSSLPPQVTNELSDLESQLDKAISRVGGVAFLKCGKKSCMDYVARVENRNSKRILESFVAQGLDDLAHFQAQSSKLSDSAVFLWCQSMVRSVAVTTGYDALEMVSRSMLASYSLNPALGSCLYVRQFVKLDPCLQFRVFSYNHKITGITQKYAIYSPWLAKHADKVSAALQTFVESRVLPHMDDQKGFCIDLAITLNQASPSKTSQFGYKPYEAHFKETGSSFEILLVQLLPFYPRAMVGLFEWSKDRNTLTDGPYDFRIRQVPTTVVKSGDTRFEQGTPLIARFWLDTMQQSVKTSIRNRQIGVAARFALVVLALVILLLILRMR